MTTPPDSQPHALAVDRVEWVAATPEAVEARVLGRWLGGAVPPAAVLVVGERRFPALGGAPDAGPAPGWGAAFAVPAELRAALEADGGASLEVGGVPYGLPPAAPGAPGRPTGTLIDPAVLAERRARRAELAEESMSRRVASAEQAAETVRTQLGHVEQRLAAATAERDGLAARLADGERRLRLAEQAGEAERRRRVEVEEELREAGRRAEAELTALAADLDDAEDEVEELRADLHRARTRAQAADPAELARLRDEVARLRSQAAAAAAAGSAARAGELGELGRLREEVVRLRARPVIHPAEVARLRAEVARLREGPAGPPAPDPDEVARLRAELARLRERPAGPTAPDPGELDDLRRRAEAAETARRAAEAEAGTLRARLAELEAAGDAPDPRLDEVERRRAALEEALRVRTADLAEVRAELDRARALVAELTARRDEDPPAAPAGAVSLGAAGAPGAGAAEAGGGAARGEHPAARRPEAATLRSALDDLRRERRVAPGPALEVLLGGLDAVAGGEGDRPAEEEEDLSARAVGPALPGLDEATRVRLAEIDAELRERAADPPADLVARRRERAGEGAPADLAAGLAGAAARLRAAAPVAEPGGDAGARPEEPPPAVPLGPRAVAPGPEGPWLAHALGLLAVRDAEQAARLLVALLPVPAGRLALTYDVAPHAHVPVRVGLAPGGGTVDAPVPGAVAPLSVAGPVPALAPLAAGGAGWRLRGARVRGSRLRLVRLLRARRAPVGLGDLAAARVAVDPALLLAALAAAVPPALTAGQRFGVAYDLGDRALEVRAADGAPIAVSTGRTTRVAAIVHTDPAAVLPLLAGTPAGARVTGDPVAVELLHGWFDRARGVAVR